MPQPRTLKRPLAFKKCKLATCTVQFRPYRAWQEFCCPAHRTEYYWQTHQVVTISNDVNASAVPSADSTNQTAQQNNTEESK